MKTADVALDAASIKNVVSLFVEAQNRDFVNKEQVMVTLESGESVVQYVNPEIRVLCRMLRRLGVFKEYDDTKVNVPRSEPVAR